MANTYWNHKGKYTNTLLKELEGHFSGLGGKAVNQFRKASNAYYQANNNGNYEAFYGTFKVGGKAYSAAADSDNPTESQLAVIHAVESRLDALIEAAHEEVYG